MILIRGEKNVRTATISNIALIGLVKKILALPPETINAFLNSLSAIGPKIRASTIR